MTRRHWLYWSAVGGALGGLLGYAGSFALASYRYELVIAGLWIGAMLALAGCVLREGEHGP